MKTKQTMFASVTAGLLAAALTGAAMPAAADCQPVWGTATATIGAPTESCPVGTVAGTVYDDSGNLIGTTTGCLMSITPSGNGALHVKMSHTFQLGTLSFTTEDQLVLAPIAPPIYRVNNSLTIVSGAAGFLRTHGTVNFGTGEVNLRFNGLICTE
jgi:hypothetical protein